MPPSLNKNSPLMRLIEGIISSFSRLLRSRSKAQTVIAPSRGPLPHLEKPTVEPSPIGPVIQETVMAPVVQEIPKVESSSAGFLRCPIKIEGQALTPFTVRISAILDHSGTAIDPTSGKKWGRSAKDQKVKAFNGEVGEGPQCPQEPCGYSMRDSDEFFKNREINYVGVLSDGGKCTLQYDGHAGYDFPYPVLTAVVAPASGELYKAAQGTDSIYSAHWGKDHSFYIKHDNGFVTWFRHCEKLIDSIEAIIGSDFTKSYRVEGGASVAYSGNFENGKSGGTPAHLHFEVRDKDWKIVDPYQTKLWRD